jgi:hypothetical protein
VKLHLAENWLAGPVCRHSGASFYSPPFGREMELGQGRRREFAEGCGVYLQSKCKKVFDRMIGGLFLFSRKLSSRIILYSNGSLISKASPQTLGLYIWCVNGYKGWYA